MNKPYFSVIIDNYNYARFLPDAINSVLAQTCTDYEIIIVDDASTDHSRQMIESYGDRVKAVFQEKNSGQGAAFNAGFAASQGEIICLLDADDLFLPDKLDYVATAAEQYPKAGLIYHRAYAVTHNLESNLRIFPLRLWHGNLKKNTLKTCESVFPPTSQLCFRRSYLEQVMPLSPFHTRIDADFPLQIIASLISEVASITTPLSRYRLHGDNWFSNDDFADLDLQTIRNMISRTEKAFHYINAKLESMGVPERVELMRHRWHKRNVFIFDEVSWWDYLSCALTNPNFLHPLDRLQFILFGMKRRREYLRSLA